MARLGRPRTAEMDDKEERERKNETEMALRKKRSEGRRV